MSKLYYVQIGLYSILWIACLASLLPLCGQNLIPDPGFQRNTNTDCDFPPEMLERAEFWYPMSGTSDWFDSNCSVNGTPNGFWSGEANSGYVGSISALNFNGNFRSEAFATPLLREVEAGKFYYLALRARNKGTDHPSEDSLLQDCPTNPAKTIQVVLGYDSLYTEIGSNSQVLSFNHSPFYAFSAPFLSGSGRSQWEALHTCLEAPVGGSHLGITLPFGTFEIAPPCEPNLNAVIYHMYYQDVDDVELIELPERLEHRVNQCDQTDGISVRVDTLFDFRALEVTYSWEDGYTGAERQLQEAGTYTIQAELPCTSIPIELEVVLNDCAPKVFVPNAFSPNNDGFNDTFGPFVEVDFPVSTYQFQVFDRWGNQVFYTKEPGTNWTGRAYGLDAANGVYVWQLSYSIATPEGITNYQERGDVILLR
ncbi:MAG: gliding motility-associated C-terminal domain-containing protein [Bacteroidota bacterium]